MLVEKTKLRSIWVTIWFALFLFAMILWFRSVHHFAYIDVEFGGERVYRLNSAAGCLSIYVHGSRSGEFLSWDGGRLEDDYLEMYAWRRTTWLNRLGFGLNSTFWAYWSVFIPWWLVVGAIGIITAAQFRETPRSFSLRTLLLLFAGVSFAMGLASAFL
jgi:hypothetical protein